MTEPRTEPSWQAYTYGVPAVFRTTGYWFAGLFALALLAFWPGYLSQLPAGGIRGYVHLHAAAMTLWFALLITQPFLIWYGMRDWHRRLGRVAYGLAPVAAASGVLLAHAGVVRDAAGDPSAAAAGLYPPIAMTAWFAACAALGLAYRKVPAIHARFMIGTGLAAIDPIAARVVVFYGPPLPEPIGFPLISWAIAAAALTVLIVAERRQPRARAVFPAMLAAITTVWALWFTLVPSPAWRGFARWFHDLPLT